MAIVMNMSSYAIEEAPAKMECGAGGRNTAWNPPLELATQQHLVTVMEKYPSLPPSLVNADAETFLQKMHAYQC
jgi:hypothetical protein